MKPRAVAVSALLCLSWLSCAPRPRSVWLTAASVKGQPLCWWRGVRWEDRAALRVRGADLVLGRARSTPGHDVRFTGTLRRAGPVAVLQGDFVGEGLTLDAAVDVGVDPVMTAWTPRRIGTAGLLLKGARVRVLDARVGRVLVVPGAEAMRPYASDEVLARELDCSEVSLRAPDGDASVVARAGYGEAPRVRLTPGFPLELSATPGEAPVGALRTELVRDAYLLTREAAAARVLVGTPDDVVWVGWVDGARVVEADAVEPTPPAEVAAPVAAASWRRCDDELRVAVLADGQTWPVGRLAPGAPFELLSDDVRDDGAVRARLHVDWFDLDDGVQVLLPGSATACRPVVAAE